MALDDRLLGLVWFMWEHRPYILRARHELTDETVQYPCSSVAATSAAAAAVTGTAHVPLSRTCRNGPDCEWTAG